MPTFPSLEWFLALRRAANANPERCRRLRAIELMLVVKVDFASASDCFELAFSGARCGAVKHLPSLDTASRGAVTVEGPYPVWREMLQNIREHGRADECHTLNMLTVFDSPLFVWGASAAREAFCSHYMRDLQEYFDAAADLTTDFP